MKCARSPQWLVLTVLLTAACSEYGVDLIPPPTPPDTGDSGDTDTNIDTGTGPVEAETCPDEAWPPRSTAVDEDCIEEPEVGSFHPIIEWSMSSFEDYPSSQQSLMTPVVGQLTDDNDDGVIDELDTPDIAIVQKHDVMRLISGDGASVHWSLQSVIHNEQSYSVHWQSGVALGKFDGDDFAELAVVFKRDNTCYGGAVSRTGALLWLNSDESFRCSAHAPAVTDLDGDGLVEVIFGHVILNGADGSLRGAGSWGSGYAPEYVNAGFHSFGADLDGDGQQEVVAGNTLYDADANILCLTGFDDGYPAAADLDGDGLGEFVVTGNDWIRLFEDDCSLIAQWEVFGGGYGGPPTIADYDGDGEPEIGVAGQVAYSVYEVDGTVRWSNFVADYSSNATGSSVYDFEGDGYAEVVYADEETLWVYHGHTGAIRLAWTGHDSATINESPVVVDVDGDGEVEIVFVGDDGVTVIGDATHSWMPGRKVWNQAAYSISNINDDLSVPSPAEPNWPAYNNFRSGDITGNVGAGIADAVPIVTYVCTRECDEGFFEMVVHIGNAGLAPLPAGISLAVYGLSDAEPTLLTTVQSSEAIPSGSSTPGFVIRLQTSSIPPGGLHISVNDDAAVSECRADNNSTTVTTGLCP